MTQTQTDALTEKFKKLDVNDQAFLKVILVSELIRRNETLDPQHRMDILSGALEVFKSAILLSLVDIIFDCPGLTDEPKSSIAALGILTYKKLKENEGRFINLMNLLLPMEEPK